MKIADRTYTYNEFKEFMSQQLTGNSLYDDTLTESIRLNVQRMKRIEKTMNPDTRTLMRLKSLTSKLNWLVITEPWCGDGAQIIPLLEKITSSTNGTITIRYILRDKNPEIMDQFLTYGSRSIPVVICTDNETEQILWKWGPRPSKIKAQAEQYKKENPAHTHYDLVYQIHKWYAEDAGKSTMRELIHLVSGMPAVQ